VIKLRRDMMDIKNVSKKDHYFLSSKLIESSKSKKLKTLLAKIMNTLFSKID